MIVSAVWFITFNCNLQCPYCWERQAQKHGEMAVEPFKPWQDWAKAWNRIKPGVLDISGGEPFMQPGFVDMLDAMDINMAITTNLTHDMTQFVQRISPAKVFSMTLSWHPTGKMGIDEFLGKCLMLKNRDFNITVNFVTYPEQLWMADYYKRRFDAHGIRFHIDPYAATKYYPFEMNDDEREFAMSLTGQDRMNSFAKEVRPVKCSGGMTHLSVQPDGSAYRCINDRILGLNPIGNILDENFTNNKVFTPCADYNKCAGCDRDKVKVHD